MEIWCVRFADTFLLEGCFRICRGEHCSPVAFTRQVDLPVRLQRAVNDRPYTAICFAYGFSGRFVGDAYMRPVAFTR